MKRLLVVLLLMITVPAIAATKWQITVQVKKIPADSVSAALAIHQAKHDSVQVDLWAKLKEAGINGWAIIDSGAGTKYVITQPDTLPIIGPIRSALGKYNSRVTVTKTKIVEP